jgi:hypothetical protein
MRFYDRGSLLRATPTSTRVVRMRVGREEVHHLLLGENAVRDDEQALVQGPERVARMPMASTSPTSPLARLDAVAHAEGPVQHG